MRKKKKRHLKKSVKCILVLLFFLSLFSLKRFTLFKLDSSFPENLETLFNQDASVSEKLEYLSQYDERIQTILEHYNDYPISLLEMLVKDLDMLDFVVDYPCQYGNVYSDTVGSITPGEIPLFLQWDKRWGYQKYGDSSVAISGCGPTALSMVYVGLTNDLTATPAKIARFAMENGYVSEVGTSWNLMLEGAQKLGLKSHELSLSKSAIFAALQAGHPIICSMRKGDFTSTGHFIVLVGISDGKIKVNDSNSKKRSSMLWEYERIEGQIKNLWEFQL